MNSASDPLTDVLETFPLPIWFAGRFQPASPWGVSIPERCATVCAVERGDCWLTSAGTGRSTRLSRGDVVVLSPDCEHRLRDVPASPTQPIHQWAGESRRPCGPPASPDALDGTGLLAGVFRFNGGGIHPLCSSLPEVVHLKRHEAEPALSVDEIVRLVDRESLVRLPGTRGIINRLFEILLLQAVRIWLAKTGGPAEGPIRGMLHPELGGVLAAMHRQPNVDWTVAGLAEQATMSRSAFSAAFAKVLGKPPLQYLRERRMELACRYLRDPSLGLKEIASRVGYDSVSAFSTAFKRFAGVSPGAYRRDF